MRSPGQAARRLDCRYETCSSPEPAILAFFFMLSVQGAERVTYEEAAKRLSLMTLHPPQITLWMADGRKLPGRRWEINAEGALEIRSDGIDYDTTIMVQDPD